MYHQVTMEVGHMKIVQMNTLHHILVYRAKTLKSIAKLYFIAFWIQGELFKLFSLWFNVIEEPMLNPLKNVTIFTMFWEVGNNPPRVLWPSHYSQSQVGCGTQVGWQIWL